MVNQSRKDLSYVVCSVELMSVVMIELDNGALAHENPPSPRSDI
jgi:hypothetical protein